VLSIPGPPQSTGILGFGNTVFINVYREFHVITKATAEGTGRILYYSGIFTHDISSLINCIRSFNSYFFYRYFHVLGDWHATAIGFTGHQMGCGWTVGDE